MYQTLEPFYQTPLNLFIFRNIKWAHKIFWVLKKYDFQDGGQELQTIVAWNHLLYIAFEPFDQTLSKFSVFLIIEWEESPDFNKRYDFQDDGQELLTIVAWNYSL